MKENKRKNDNKESVETKTALGRNSARRSCSQDGNSRRVIRTTEDFFWFLWNEFIFDVCFCGKFCLVTVFK